MLAKVATLGRGNLQMEKVVFTIEEAAARLGISRGAAYQAAAQGELPVIRIGRRLLVPRAAFYGMLAAAGNKRANLNDDRDRKAT